MEWVRLYDGSGANVNKLTTDVPIGAVGGVACVLDGARVAGRPCPALCAYIHIGKHCFWTERPCPVVYDRIHAE